jgi:uncharacterized protein (UPF0179 family)
MIFTGNNLRLVRQGLSYALQEVHNQIATCPDVIHYADDIDALEVERTKLERLKARVDRAIAKEEEQC